MLNTANIRSALFNLVTSTASFTSANTDSAKFAGDSIASSALPFCIIQFTNAEFEYETIGSPRSARIASTFTISIFAANQTQLDTLTAQVLNAIDGRTLGGNTQELKVTDVAYEFSSEADAEYGRATISLMTEHTSTIND